MGFKTKLKNMYLLRIGAEYNENWQFVISMDFDPQFDLSTGVKCQQGGQISWGLKPNSKICICCKFELSTMKTSHFRQLWILTPNLTPAQGSNVKMGVKHPGAQNQIQK